ncbi:MAG: hypothetical protein LBE84_06645 [Planctomycetota bacterium]|jgi:hypothetical protein|nr:hypothetical protein [Planctomycetota bacterium]
MAKRNRRQAAADMERLKTLAATMNSGRRIELRRHLWLFILIVLVWAALAGLPSFFVDKPVPYMVGSTAAFDIHSRVEFTWHDEMAEAQALRNLEQT